MSASIPQHETARAAAAYADYAAMARPRSLGKLCEQLRQSNGKPAVTLRTLETWSSAFDWQARVKAHDEASAKARERRREVAREAMEDRHAAQAQAVFDRMSERLTDLAERGEIGGQAAAVAWKSAAEIERAALGAPTRIDVQATVQGEVTHDLNINLAADSEAAALANAFLRRLTALREGESGGSSLSGE